MRPSPGDPPAALRPQRWPARPCVAALLAIVALALGCRKSERAAAGSAAPAASGKAAPAKPAATGAPVIHESPEAGERPFAGLNAPRDAAIDENGRLWITDFGHAAVRIYDAAGGSFGGFGAPGSGQHQLKDPCGIAIHGDDLYVADTWNGRVERFTLAVEWRGKAPGDFYGPRAVAVAPDGRVWIADTGNNRVVLCERDLTNPRYFGSKGDGPEQLASPVGIAAGPSGRVYVADTMNRRVQVLESDGRFRARFPFEGWGASTEPYLEVDAAENLYASDPAAGAVVQLDRNGRERKRWTQDDTGRRFARPTGLALDEKKRVLYVVNRDDGTVGALKLP